MTDLEIKAKNDAADANNLASTNNAISSANLNPTSPTVIPTAPKDTTDYQGITQGIIGGLDTLTTQTNDAQKTKENTQSGIIDTMNSLLGKTADTQTANETSGLNDATKQLNMLNAQAKQLNREALAIPIQTQQRNANTGATDAGVAPQTTGALRENALKALSIAQQADVATANYTAAKDKATQIIDLKYKPLEAQLEIKKQQYEFNKDSLSALDKKRTEALGVALKKEEQDLADKKAQEKTIQDMLLTAQTNQAPIDILNTATDMAKSGKNVLDIAKTLGKYGGDYQKVELLKEQILTEKAQRNKINAETGLATGQSGVANPAYSGIISTILGSGKFTKEQSSAITKAINNGEDPLTVIKNQAKNILGQTEGTKITNFEVAKSAMTDLQNSLAQFYQAGGSTYLLSGTTEKVINKLGEVKNPALVDLATQIQAQLQIYRNAVSGTAYSVQEGKDIASVFPGINKTQGLNSAILNGRMKAFDSVIDGSYRTALGGAYDNLKKIGTTNTTSSTPNPFQQSLGISTPIPGTSIISGISNGTINFNIPNTPTR